VPVLLGILPLQSFRHAEFMHNEVPGIDGAAGAARPPADAGADGAGRGREARPRAVQRRARAVRGRLPHAELRRYENVLEVIAESAGATTA
jgi:homocysteine S-methyltransferase